MCHESSVDLKEAGSGGNLISEPAPPGNKMKLRKNVLLDEGSAGPMGKGKQK